VASTRVWLLGVCGMVTLLHASSVDWEGGDGAEIKVEM